MEKVDIIIILVLAIQIFFDDQIFFTYHNYFYNFQYNPWNSDDVLYVGTTFTQHGDYRHDVPAISSRNLDNLQFAEFSFSRQSLLRIDVKYRDHFLVDYVHGFNSVTVQKKSYLPGEAEAGYVTRISRTCITDANFDTYSEVTLECHLSGENYNLLQAAITVPASKKVNFFLTDIIL